MSVPDKPDAIVPARPWWGVEAAVLGWSWGLDDPPGECICDMPARPLPALLDYLASEGRYPLLGPVALGGSACLWCFGPVTDSVLRVHPRERKTLLFLIATPGLEPVAFYLPVTGELLHMLGNIAPLLTDRVFEIPPPSEN